MRSALVFAVMAACGGHQSPGTSGTSGAHASSTLPSGPPLVTPGERMSYVLQLGGMDLATYDLGVGEPTSLDGKQAIAVVGHARSSGLASLVRSVDDTFTSWIAADTGRPLRWLVDEGVKDSELREKTDAQLASRDGATVPVSVVVGEKHVEETQTVSLPEVWDYNSFLIALRSWEGARGSSIDAEVFRSRYMWHVHMTIDGKEKLVTPMGEFPSLRLEGHAYRINRDGKKDASIDERDFTIWISDDGGRVPLQTIAHTDYGEVTLTIVDYQSGAGSPLRH